MPLDLPFGERVPTPLERRKAQLELARAGRKQERLFERAASVEFNYARALRGLARQLSEIIEAIWPQFGINEQHHAVGAIEAAMDAYMEGIDPWVTAVAGRMVAQSKRRDDQIWRAYTQELGEETRALLASAPMAPVLRELLDTQRALIKSLPDDAIQRLHEEGIGALAAGRRYGKEQIAELVTQLRPEVAAQYHGAMPRGYQPPKGEPWYKRVERKETMAEFLTRRATLIAATESGRTATKILEARATFAGSEEYIWKTAGDWKVRPTHKKLNGTKQKWAEPPLTDPPDHHAHPGCIFNCRCTALPLF